MENDSIRASGSDTLVDIWIDGKMRSICISQEAIGAYLDFEQLARMSDDDRCGFVKNNMSLVLSAAKARLRDTDVTANLIALDAGHLPRPDAGTADRRKTERRNTDRRKVKKALTSQQDRRRTDRRRGDRRTRTPKKET
jgi:hypothetical protein